MAAAAEGNERWCFNAGKWNPSDAEWARALALLQPEEAARVGRFVRLSDRKLAMGARLLARRCIANRTGKPLAAARLARTKAGKPFWVDGTLDFNLSHHGDYVALACFDPAPQNPYLKELDLPRGVGLLGVDVMRVECRQDNLEDFFGAFKDYFFEEWKWIRAGTGRREQLTRFMRCWCVKEAYIKALGIGLGFGLERLEVVPPEPDGPDVCGLIVDRAPCGKAGWRLEEGWLDAEHCACVMLRDGGGGGGAAHGGGGAGGTPTTFREWTFDELVAP